ncbi:MAG: polysaccharide biosynthesis protein [Opitutales bacterium]|nr:polysaccharide biosynthesis protein [Opitutales bacterium]
MSAYRFSILTFGSALVALVSLWLSYQLRYDFRVPTAVMEDLWVLMLWLIPVKLLFLSLFGQLDALPGFLGWADVKRIAAAMGIVAVLLLVLNIASGGIGYWAPPRSVAVIDALFSSAGLLGFRLFLNRMHSGVSELIPGQLEYMPVAVIGAGEAGALFAQALQRTHHNRRRVVCFLDDDARKWGSTLLGIPVLGGPEKLPALQEKYGFRSVVIAIPSARQKRIRELVRLGTDNHCRIEILPNLADLNAGISRITDLHQPQIEDVLGRPEIDLNTDSIRESIAGKVVLVTGAGGSIGSELAIQIAAAAPALLVLIERNEPSLYTTESLLRKQFPQLELRPRLLDLRDAKGLESAFKQDQPELVFHAAAHKHVPITEREPVETLRNNTFVTRDLVQLALRSGVGRFVFVSTDKAVNPVNLLGLSKFLGESCVRAAALAAAEVGGFSIFASVRFGNVLGSSGSVIPLFKQQIAQGGPVTVTDPEATRYFMTLSEAVGLVLQCGAMAEGGETFVLDMGEPVNIYELARQMIQLSGYEPEVDIQIQSIGLRPGEKLHEDLYPVPEARESTSNAHIFKAREAPIALEPLEALLRELEEELERDPKGLRDWLTQRLPTQGGIGDN